MQNHMYLARVPQGQERDYIQGLLRFLYRDNDKVISFIYYINVVVVVAMWSVFVKGINRVFSEGASIAPAIGMLIFSIIFTCTLFGIALLRHKRKMISRFNNIRVLDVQLVNPQVMTGHGTTCLANLMFADGTVSTTRHKCLLYAIGTYQYGLLVIVYNDNGQFAESNLIPRMDVNLKAYSLAMREKMREVKITKK